MAIFENKYCLILIILLLASCSTVPPENIIQTAIAQTQLVQPTSTSSSTSTPNPTDIPIPTSTSISEPSPTIIVIQKHPCAPDFHLVNIVLDSGKGVFVKVSCSETEPDEVLDIQLILPIGTSKDMENDAIQYMHQVASLYEWDRSDIDIVIQQAIDNCNSKIFTSRKILGFCISVKQESKIIAIANNP